MANGGSINYTVNFNVNKTGLDQLRVSLQEIKAMTANDLLRVGTSGSLPKAKQDLESLKTSIGQIETAFQRAFNTNLGTLNVAKFNSELKKLNLNKIYSDFSSAGAAGQAAFRNVTAQVLTTNMQLKQTNTLVASMARTLGNTIKWGAASAVMNGFTRSVRQAYGYVKNLDTSLNSIRIVTGKSADEMERFAKKANNAAKALGQTTTNYTDAALIYYQQGLSDKDVEARAETTLKAANVTGQTGEEVSEQLTAVWNGYKVSAEEAELYIDKLAAVAAKTASNLEELSTGMSKVASAANTMGVNADQLAAQISTIISVTRQAPESVGTALKTIYARMSDLKLGETDEDGLGLGDVSGQMESMGTSIIDASGNLRDMGIVIEEVAGKWDTWTEAQKTAMAQVMAGKRQYNNLMALFENWDKYEMALNVSENSEGTLQKQQDTYMESVKAHAQQLKANIEDLYDSMTDPKALNPMIDSLSKIIGLFRNFVDSIGGGGSALLALSSIMTNVFSKQLASGIASFVVNIQAGKDNVRQLAAEFEILNQYQNAKIDDPRTQQLIQMKQQVLDLDKAITNEERNIANEYIRQQNTLFQQQDELQNKLTITSELITQLSGVTMNSATQDGRDAMKASLQSELDYFKGYKDNIKQTEEAFNKLSIAKRNNAQSSQENLSAENTYKTALQTQGDIIEQNIQSANNLILEGKLEREERERLTSAIERYNKVVETAGTKSLDNVGVFNAAKGVQEAYANAINRTNQKINDGITFLDGYTRRASDNATAMTNLNQSYNSFINTIDLRSKIQQSIQMISAVGQLASAWRTLSNLGSIWSNEDLSTGEKILQTVTNLGFALPMLVNSIKTLVPFQAAATAANEAYTASLIRRYGVETSVSQAMSLGLSQHTAFMAMMALETASEEVQIKIREVLLQLAYNTIDAKAAEAKINEILAASNFKVAGSGEAAGAAMGSFLKNMGAMGWILAAAAAIAAVVKVVDLLTVSAKEAGEALDESIEQYKELTSELESLESELETTKNRIEELLKLASDGELSIVEEQELKRLEAENAALETQIELIKQKQALELRSVANNASVAKEKGTYDVRKVTNTPFRTDYTDSSGTFSDSPEKVQYFANRNQFLNTSGFEIQAGEIKIDDSSTFDSWMASMQELYAEAIEKQGGYDEGSADYKAFGAIAKEISNTMESYQKTYEKERLNYTSQLEEGYNAALESLPALKANNTIGQYDDDIKYYEDIIYNYIKQMGQLESSVGKGIDMLSLSSDQKMNLQTSEEVINEENETINEDVLTDIIGEKNLESLKMYSEELGLSVYDIIKTYQEMNGLLGLSNEALEEKLNEIRQEKINSVTEAINEKYGTEYTSDTVFASIGGGSGPSSSDETNKKYEIDDWEDISNVALENFDAIVEYINEATIKSEGLATALEEALTAYQKEENRKEFQSSTESKGESYSEKYDIDAEAYEELTKTLHGNSEAFEGLDEEIEATGEVAQEVAKDIMRFDKACEKVKDSSEEWLDALEDGNIQDKAEAIGEMREAYGNLLDMDGDSLSSEFLNNADNLKLMQEAANGSEEAYNSLAEAAAKDILVQCGIDTAQFEADKAYINGIVVDDTAFPDLEVGASLNNEDFLNSLSDMVNAAGMTAAQATDYLSSMGVDAEVIEDETNGTETNEYTGAIADVTTEPVDYVNPITGDVVHSQVPTITYTADPVRVDTEKSQKSFGLKVISANKSSGGNFKYKNSSHGGGGKGKKSGGGGGGGGGSKPKKQDKKEGKIDRYHDVNLKIDKLSRNYDKLTTTQERLTGKDLIKNLNQQLDIIEKQLEASKEKVELMKQERDELKKTLQEQGVKFDGDDVINYKEIMQAKLDELNAFIEKYNAMSAAEQEANAELLEQKQEEYDKFLETFERYDELVFSEMADEFDNQMSLALSKVEKQIEAFNVEIEVKLDLREATEDWKEFENEYLKDFSFDENAFGKRFENAVNNLMDFLGNENNSSLLSTLTEDIITLERDIKYYKAGEFDKISEDSRFAFTNPETKSRDFDIKQAEEALKEQKEQVQNTYETYFDYLDEMFESFSGSLEAEIDAIDEYHDALDQVNDSLEHTKEIISLISGEDAFGKMADVLGEQVKVSLQQLEQYTEDINTYQTKINDIKETLTLLNQQVEIAMASGDEITAQTLLKKKASLEESLKIEEEALRDSLENRQDEMENYLSTLQEQYETFVKQVNKELELLLTGGKGFETLEKQWEHQKNIDNMYLDTVNRAYEIRSLEADINEKLNNTDSLATQKKLNEFKEKELAALKEKDKLTQYDVERAEKLLDIEMKKIALEEAQQNKSKMRLRRDASGNYSYQFVADDDSISKAQKELEDAQNSLYNFDKDRATEMAEEQMSIYKDMQDYIVWYSEQSVEYRIANEKIFRETVGKYQDQMIDNADLASTAIANAQISAYESMRDAQKDIVLGDIVPAFTTGVQEMIDIINGKDNSFESAFDNMLDSIFEKGGANSIFEEGLLALETIGEKIKDEKGNFDFSSYYDSALNKSKEYADAQKDNIKNTSDQVIEIIKLNEQIEKLTGNLQELESSYDALYKSPKLSVAEFFLNKDNSSLLPSLRSLNRNIKIKNLEGFTSGGYTGDWSGQDGKLAILHKKELVLNARDTENMLKAIQSLRYFVTGTELDNLKRTRDLINLKDKYQEKLTNNQLLEQQKDALKNSLSKEDNNREIVTIAKSLKQYFKDMHAEDEYNGYTTTNKQYEKHIADLNKQFKTLDPNTALLLEEQIDVLNKKYKEDSSIQTLVEEVSNMYASMISDRINQVNSFKDQLSGMINTLNGTFTYRMDNLLSSIEPLLASLTSTNSGISQNIEVHADFPNATNAAEIEAALRSLPNAASQYAFKNKR